MDGKVSRIYQKLLEKRRQKKEALASVRAFAFSHLNDLTNIYAGIDKRVASKIYR
jgi:hypothetical protein